MERQERRERGWRIWEGVGKQGGMFLWGRWEGGRIAGMEVWGRREGGPGRQAREGDGGKESLMKGRFMGGRGYGRDCERWERANEGRREAGSWEGGKKAHGREGGRLMGER